MYFWEVKQSDARNRTAQQRLQNACITYKQHQVTQLTFVCFSLFNLKKFFLKTLKRFCLEKSVPVNFCRVLNACTGEFSVATFANFTAEALKCWPLLY